MKCALLLSLVAAAFAVPRCDDDIQLSLTVTAVNLIDPKSIEYEKMLNLSGYALKSMLHLLPISNKTSCYIIAGRYCEPEVSNPSRANTMQLLVHGAGYDRNYWSGEGLPGSPQQVNGTEYSWVDYASQQGYPTFSIDRICNGRSSHPEAALCQISLNAATIHEIVRVLRRGDVGGRPFDKIIIVGHSLGSLSANIHSKLYPYDGDAYVLTGYTLRGVIGFDDISPNLMPAPAALILPDKYGFLGPDYVVATNRSGYEILYYHGDYEKTMVNIDFRDRGTIASGELITSLLGTIKAPLFYGHVFVLNGQEDKVFCSRGKLPADCGTGKRSASSQVRVLYENAKSFSWAQTQNAGHVINFHSNAQRTFATAHNWINSLKFEG